MSVKYRLVSIVGTALFCAAAFFGLSASAFAATNHTTTQSVVNAAPGRGCPTTLTPGDRGPAVRQLQTALRNHGFRDARGHALSVTNRYDNDTLRAVKRFEAQHHLPQNGRVDAREWQLLGVCGR